jgi:hypothetical protein
MPDPLKLAALMAQAIATIPKPGSPSWQREMERIIARGHTAAWIAGQAERLGVKSDSPLISQARLSRVERAEIKSIVDAQLAYFKGFQADIAGMSEAQIKARAQLYAGATRGTYSRTRWADVPLPFHPTEGTECITRCRCSWELQRLEGDGNYDAYWRMGAVEQHCITCPTRANGSPYRIRAGVLQ